MAASAERQMNLAALQQRDPYITGIVDTASQVALYSFSAKSNEWEKTDKEGTLFVYTRSASPINGFMILNRLGLNDLIEPINKKLEFQLQDPFLLYRNGQAAIYGIWFYDKDECARIGQLMNSLVHVAAETQEKDSSTAAGRQRRASESDTLYERAINEYTDPAMNPKSNVDILQMLSKAQDEYDKSAGHVSPSVANGQGPTNKTKAAAGGRRAEPKPMIDNPSASATKTTPTLIKPLALKASQSEDGEEFGAAAAVEPSTPNTQISLDQLFKRATSLQQDTKARQEPAAPIPVTAPVRKNDQMPPLLQRLMSNQGATLEEIERQQRGEFPRDQMPQPAGAEAPPRLPNGAMPVPIVRPLPNEPESPNTALKRTLNILPSIGDSRQSGPPPGTLLAHGLLGHPPVVAEPEEVHLGLMRQSSVDSSLVAKPPAASCTTGRTGPGEGLITPQALLQTAAASLPPASGASVHAQNHHIGAAHLGMAANILLSPMAFQTASPSSAQTLSQPSGTNLALSESGSTHSVSPHDFPPDNFHRPQQESLSNVCHLTRDQFQQAFIHLMKTDSNFLSSLHEGYVKCLHQSLLGKPDKS